MTHKQTRHALIGRYLAEPDALAWRAWADACEEAGDDRQAALWRFRAEHFRTVEREAFRLLDQPSEEVGWSLEVHTPHDRVSMTLIRRDWGLWMFVQMAKSDSVATVKTTAFAWDADMDPAKKTDRQRRLRERLIGMIDAAFALRGDLT